MLQCNAGLEYRLGRIASIIDEIENLPVNGLPLIVLYQEPADARKAYDYLYARSFADKPLNDLLHLVVPFSAFNLKDYCRARIRKAKMIVTSYEHWTRLTMQIKHTVIVTDLPRPAESLDQIEQVCMHTCKSEMCDFMYFLENEASKKGRARGARLRAALHAL